MNPDTSMNPDTPINTAMKTSQLLKNGFYQSRRLLSFFLCVLLLSQTSLVNAADETRYISDVFYVPLHSGNSTKHRIIHRGLKTGTRLSLLETDDDAGFSRVITTKGTEGWIQNQFLSATPIARLRLADAQNKQQQLQRELTRLESNNKETKQSNNDIQKQVKLLSRQNQNLTAELASIKKISANAINLDTNNRELLKKNEMLKIEIAELQANNSRLSDKSDKEWFFRGSLAVLIGVFLAILLPKLKPKARSREWS